MSRNKAKALEFLDEVYRVNVTGRNVQVTEPMKQYAIEKISKIEHLTNKIIDVNVTMDIQRFEQRVDIVLKFDHIKIKSQASSDNMYASIDKAVDKIKAQIRHYRTKIRDHQAKGVKALEMNVNVIRVPRGEELLDVDEVNEEIETQNERSKFGVYEPHHIVKRESMPLKVLTQDEAIMKMELSGDEFLIFRNEEDLKLKVIYRREDGDFGVIEPEG